MAQNRRTQVVAVTRKPNRMQPGTIQVTKQGAFASFAISDVEKALGQRVIKPDTKEDTVDLYIYPLLVTRGRSKCLRFRIVAVPLGDTTAHTGLKLWRSNKTSMRLHFSALSSLRAAGVPAVKLADTTSAPIVVSQANDADVAAFPIKAVPKDWVVSPSLIEVSAHSLKASLR